MTQLRWMTTGESHGPRITAVVDGIVAGNRSIVFGEDALQNMLHVRIVHPLADGVISDPDSARDFLKHIRSIVDPSGSAEIRAVVGIRNEDGVGQSIDDRLKLYRSACG